MRLFRPASLLLAACAFLDAAGMPGAAEPAAAAAGAARPAAPSKPEPPRPAVAEVSGTVTGPGGQPVANATVRIRSIADPKAPRPAEQPPEPTVTATGQDGSFRAPSLAGSRFAVRVEAPGQAPFTARDIPAGASLRVVLKPGAGAAGRVLDLGRKEPVPAATVLAWDPDADLFGDAACRRAVTGDDGRFRIGGLPAGTVVLDVSARGYVRARQRPITVDLPAEASPSPPEKLIYLRPGGRMSGRVVSGSGAPVEGVKVVVSPADPDAYAAFRDATLPPATTDAAGKFAFDGVPAGARVRLRAAKKGGPAAESETFSIDAGTERSGLEIRLEEAAALKVRLVDREGKGVTGLDVDLEESGKRATGPMGYGDRRVAPDRIELGDEGRFTVRSIRPGTYTVHLVPEGFEDLGREEVKLRAGETADLGTITVSEGTRVSGRVTDATGASVSGASVEAVWVVERKSKRRRATTSTDGHYRLGGLGDVPLRDLSVRADGFVRARREGVPPGSVDVDFVLERDGSVLGKVTGAGGAPPVAFRVKLFAEARGEEGVLDVGPRAGERHEKAFSGPGGLFRMDAVEPGTYTVEVTADGFAPARKASVKVESERDTDVGSIVLEKGALVSGRVLDAAKDTPVAGASVRVSAPRNFGFQLMALRNENATVTGPDGSFRVEGVGAGAYSVVVDHPDFSPAVARVEIEAGADPPEIVVRLSRGGTLTGTVKDRERRPVQGATILITAGLSEVGDARSAVTDADGRYVEERLRAGVYQVLRAPERPADAMVGLGVRSATIRDGETTVLDFDETPAIQLSGRVLRGGRPLPSALLFFTAGEGAIPGEWKTAQADAEGNYRIGLDHGGTYRVMAQPGGAGGFTGGSAVELQVPEAPEPVLDIVLFVSAISGTVKDEGGKPLKDATVVARRDGSESADLFSEGIAQPDATGAFSIDGLTPGLYRVTATAPGYRMAEAYPVPLSARESAPPLDLRLSRGKALRGQVVDPRGRGIEGALVFLAAAGSTSAAAPMPAETDVNGTFVATAPTEDPVDVVAVAGGWAPALAFGVVPSGGDGPDVVLRASAGGSIRVRVTGADGQPAAGVSLAITSVPPSLGDVVAVMRQPPPTGMDGSAVLDLLAPGTYLVGIPARRNMAPVEVRVLEGTEAVAAIRLPSQR